ncbi:LysR family transcriptional regulator [Chitinilyticum piscinae]|uniref:LysR family transcriptional regulator n=1 Tax=Chitinilyticum piscinae TaxID=2866724 RepID=A0A8J7FVD9_9NEIS|nr:LysR family transcriptional regulator [Chitinilyticum piscinae]MBE9607910.1 LysR family transcriptional regulator [Chitinilyticum piscinae]
METMTASQQAQELQWAMAFACVAEQGSFTRAAEVLGVSKALLSKQVAQLERRLDAQLLYRTTRRLDLTEAGRLYLAHCRDWLARVAAARQALGELRSEIGGTLRITAPSSFGGVFMAEALLAFRERYPAICIELDLGATPRDLEAEGFDLAIRANLPPPEHLVSRPLVEIRDWLVASPQFLARHPPLETPDQLAGLPCIANQRFRHAREWSFSRGGQLHTVAVPSPISSNDYYLIRNLALNHGGIARLPAYLASPDVASGRLVRVLPDCQLQGMRLSLMYPQRLPQPAKLLALLDFLQEWFADPRQAAMLA